MSLSKTKKSSSDKPPQKRRDRAAEIANTFEWLITAFILAFVFRAFVMEAFRIPTGSMADTLKGAHFRLRCRQCGYRYEYGFVPQKYDPGFPEDYVPPPGNLRSFPSRCPSCGYYQATGGAMPVANGDRILVLKCLYQFFEPERWDVIVFKNPLDPRINYIKRLVGLPGEKLEIIDGDVYKDGQIRRKPPKVQNRLWMPVYDNDYQPVNPYTPAFNHHQWAQPFKAGSFSKWEIDEASPTLFRLDSSADQINSMVYSTSIGNGFRATYAYDDVREYNHLPYCSDLMVRFYANAHESEGLIGIELSKYETHYKAWVDLTGEMFITKNEKNGKITELARESIEPPTINKSALVKFANVDHQLVFQFGGKKLTWDLGYSPEAAGPRKTKIEPQVRIFGSGRLTLSHVAVFRDIHYTAPNGLGQGRAAEDNPFTLGKDEFFVLGDNSPNSQDSRFWNRPGLANKGRPPFLFGVELEFKSDLDNRIISEELRHKFEENQILLSQHITVSIKQEGSAWVITDNLNVYFVRKEKGRLNIYLSPYRAGTVPSDYLVGKALFIYWPSGFKFPWPESLRTFLFQNSRHSRLCWVMYRTVSWNWIPSIGQMRFIYGGSNKSE